MRTIFITHNDLGLRCLETLEELGADIRTVYTRRPSTDGTNFEALRTFAGDAGITLDAVESVNVDGVVAAIQREDPELLFVVGWSRLVDPEVFEIASEGAFGMHPAPLPRGRGRAPIAWNLIKGLDETALSMFHLVKEPDAGDLVGQKSIEIDVADDASTLFDKVLDAGEQLIRTYYPRFEDGDIPRIPQDDAAATWWPKRRPRHGLVDWNQSARTVYNWIRGQTHPYPGSFSYLNGRKVTLWAAEPPGNGPVFARPGEILGRVGDGLEVAAWESSLVIRNIEVEDGGEMPAADLLQCEDIAVGDEFQNARDRLS